MESGLSASSIDETQESEDLLWQNGQDILLNALEQSSLESDASLEQSAEQSQVETYSPEYDMGAYTGYSLQSVSYTMSQGVCVGFAVALVVALATWGVACAISILRKGGNQDG